MSKGKLALKVEARLISEEGKAFVDLVFPVPFELVQQIRVDALDESSGFGRDGYTITSRHTPDTAVAIANSIVKAATACVEATSVPRDASVQ